MQNSLFYSCCHRNRDPLYARRFSGELIILSVRRLIRRAPIIYWARLFSTPRQHGPSCVQNGHQRQRHSTQSYVVMEMILQWLLSAGSAWSCWGLAARTQHANSFRLTSAVSASHITSSVRDGGKAFRSQA